MKHYKNKMIIVGSSDIASLILRGCDNLFELRLGEDGVYLGYHVEDENVEIPEHYKLVFETYNWLKIYDDTKLTHEFQGKSIRVYKPSHSTKIIIQTIQHSQGSQGVSDDKI